MGLSLVDEARNAWKLWSVQIPVISGGLVGTYYEVLTPAQQAIIPDWVVHILVIVAFFSGALSRVVKQTPPNP